MAVTLLPRDLRDLELRPRSGPAASTDVPHVPHVPKQPEWFCLGCREDWPCAEARADLRAQRDADPTSTKLYLAAQADQAVVDLGGVPGPDHESIWQRIFELREPGGAS